MVLPKMQTHHHDAASVPFSLSLALHVTRRNTKIVFIGSFLILIVVILSGDDGLKFTNYETPVLRLHSALTPFFGDDGVKREVKRALTDMAVHYLDFSLVW